MKTYKYILPILCAGAVMASCDDLFEPSNEMISDIEVMYHDPLFASGLLGNAYLLMPYSGTPSSDLATDDAVSNVDDNAYRRMAAGAWSSTNDPMSQWQARNNAINYCNILLENVDQVVWSGEAPLNQMFIDLMKGDAIGMRAIQRFYLLRAHAGKVGGELMGVPFFNDYQTGASDLNLERLTFKECIDSIMSDINVAMTLLPENYADIEDKSQIPAKYQAIGADMGGYNRAFGDHHHGKVCGQILKTIKAQVLLFAASPAYGTASWQQAAEAAAAVIGEKKVVENGHTWYTNGQEIDDVKRTQNTPEAIWMTNPGTSNSIESDNYPPSLYGNGRTNPTQNLVDAFPMANGFPISDSRSGYDPKNPYAGRDPRLNLYVVVDGSAVGPNDAIISTGNKGNATDDGIDKTYQKSTRTGYYMRKLLREAANVNPNSPNSPKHYTARIRWTELFLAYAEAANEAAGPTTAVGGTSQTAKSIIKAIRERAGICVGVTDPYLEECAGSKEKMRELIHNERRLELCFENHRFYDLRRWNENLNAQISGMNSEARASEAGLNYGSFNLETLKFESYMTYGPVPDSEIKKFSNLQQNDGWR